VRFISLVPAIVRLAQYDERGLAHPFTARGAEPYRMTVYDTTPGGTVAVIASDLRSADEATAPDWTVAVPAGRTIQFVLTDAVGASFSKENVA
jgi:hypothetical protein